MPAHADQSVIQRVPLSQLFLSQLNVRKGEVEEGIPELAASILKDGVLQNLVGYEERPKRGSKKPSRKEVTAGGRRWRALQLLLKQKKINGSYLVPFKLVSKAEAIVVSLIENAHRKSLHPADEFEAALALLEEGKSIEDIAARLHLEPIIVQRRLELARVAPEFIDDYRQGKLITLEHLLCGICGVTTITRLKEAGLSMISTCARARLTAGPPPNGSDRPGQDSQRSIALTH